MDIRKIGGIVAVLVLVIILGAFVVQRMLTPSSPGGIDLQISTTPQAVTPAKREPEVHFYKKGAHSIVVEWKNLPVGTTELDILRSYVGKGEFVKWKTIAISKNGSNGSAELTLGTSERTDSFVFQAQAIGSSSGGGGSPSTSSSSSPSATTGEVLWKSESAPASPLPTSTAQAAGSPNLTQPQTPDQGVPSSTVNPPSLPAASSTTPSASPAPQPGQNPSYVYYYTPQGTLSGTSTIARSDLFWVNHSAKAIEIGWQGISSLSDDVIISRSPNQNGPWTKLLEQKNPPLSYTVRIVDNTLDESGAYYYKLEAYSEGSLVGTYGPILFSPAQ